MYIFRGRRKAFLTSKMLVNHQQEPAISINYKFLVKYIYIYIKSVQVQNKQVYTRCQLNMSSRSIAEHSVVRFSSLSIHQFSGHFFSQFFTFFQPFHQKLCCTYLLINFFEEPTVCYFFRIFSITFTFHHFFS